MKKTITIIAALFASNLSAGEMRTFKDKFTGETAVQFVSTTDEAIKAKAIVWITKGSAGKAQVTIKPYPKRVTTCNQNYLFLKDSKGVIHKIDADEIEHRKCTFEIERQHIAKGFEIRLPLYNDGNLDFRFSTVGLKFDQLTD
jgi:hypothetical protein